MKVFLIVRSTGSTSQFKYYLSPDFILMEHIDPIKHKTTFHLLEISKIVTHHIDQNSRKVKPYDYKNIGKWGADLSKTTFMKESKPYMLNGRECIERRFKITSSRDSSFAHLDSNDTEGEKVKIYCKIPEIYQYISEEFSLKFLSAFYEADANGFDFCIRSYYSYPDQPESSTGFSISRAEEIMVADDFFDKFLQIPEEDAKE